MELPDVDAPCTVAIEKTHDFLHVSAGPIVRVDLKVTQALRELEPLQEARTVAVHALQMSPEASQTADPTSLENLGFELPRILRVLGMMQEGIFGTELTVLVATV